MPPIIDRARRPKRETRHGWEITRLDYKFHSFYNNNNNHNDGHSTASPSGVTTTSTITAIAGNNSPHAFCKRGLTCSFLKEVTHLLPSRSIDRPSNSPAFLHTEIALRRFVQPLTSSHLTSLLSSSPEKNHVPAVYWPTLVVRAHVFAHLHASSSS